MRNLSIVILLLVLGTGVFIGYRHGMDNYVLPMRESAKMMSVRFILADALSDYYQEQGRYPHALSDLPLETLPWGDEGSTVEDAAPWLYASEGTRYTMTWTNSHTDQISMSGQDGKTVY